MERGPLIHDPRCSEALVLKSVAAPGTGQAPGWVSGKRVGPKELRRDPWPCWHPAPVSLCDLSGAAAHWESGGGGRAGEGLVDPEGLKQAQSSKGWTPGVNAESRVWAQEAPGPSLDRLGLRTKTSSGQANMGLSLSPGDRR